MEEKTTITSISDLFLANELEVTQIAKKSAGQLFKEEYGHSKRMIRNMKKAGCDTMEQYKLKLKKRKRNEQTVQNIKKRQSHNARIHKDPKPKFVNKTKNN